MNLLVFGQGKSGTTVIAKAIQHSLPGAAFLMEPKSEEALVRHHNAPHRVVKILYGQWTSQLTSLTKVLRNESETRFERIVKIIRDPRDQAISCFLYNFYNLAKNGRAADEQLQELIDRVRAKEQCPQAISFATLCAEVNRIMRWKGYSSRWLLTESGLVANRGYWNYLTSLKASGHLLRYESFMQGDLAELESYLGTKLSSRREVDEYGRTRRSASWGNWREFFTPEDVALLRPLCGDLFEEMGYPDWDLQPVAQLNPAHFSEYLLKLLREARSG